MGLVSVRARRPAVARSLAHYFPRGMYEASKYALPFGTWSSEKRHVPAAVKAGDNAFGKL